MATAKPCTKLEEEISIEVYAGWVADLTWISHSDTGVSQAFRCVCNSHISVAVGGKYDAFRQATRSQHGALNLAAQRNDHVTSFFVNQKDQEIIKCVIVTETLFANVVAEHNLSFQFADHFTKVVKNMFLDRERSKKFSCGCQKTTVIVKRATGLRQIRLCLVTYKHFS